MNRKAVREKHGFNRSDNPIHRKAYQAWTDMRCRCHNPLHIQFKDWGGRGITVCERWNSFLSFIADVGWPTPGVSLERVDNDGHYEPGNVIWSSKPTQNRNQRKTKLSLEIAAQIRSERAAGQTFGQLARRYGISRGHVAEITAGRRWLSNDPRLTLARNALI